MITSVSLRNQADDAFKAEVEYELTKERVSDEAPIYRIVYCKVLTVIPSWFEVYDIKTDIEETISLDERIDARLNCRIEFSEEKKWSRIASINKECEFLKVA